MPIIPANNPISMIAYYLGIFSVIPCLGAVLSLPAIVCGVIGLVNANKDPQVGGKGHAIAGILLGILGQLFWIAVWFAIGVISAIA
ncbi:MAG: DUF4190 domain-containing protein [Pirellulaceae bacterium]